MTDEQLLKRLGEDFFGWEFLNKTKANLPDPLDPLSEALAGKRRPVFWSDLNSDGTYQFFVAEPGPNAVPWNPLENEEQRERILAKVDVGG